jgi:hypothetical protein
MRVIHYLALLGILTCLGGCACLPGGKAANALNALEQPPSALKKRDEIPSRRF